MGLLSNAIAGKLVEKALSSKSKPAVSPAPGAPGAAPQQDALDKMVGSVLSKTGHGQSTATTEKISDGIRSVFKKTTGKDVPIPDKS